MSVTAAGNIAGKARNKPATPGPHFSATMPVAAVMAPPKTKRIIYSCQRVRRSAERSAVINIVSYRSSVNQNASAAANQSGMRAAAVSSADKSRRIKSQQAEAV